MESRATTTKKQKKKSEDMIASLYRYSDLSVQAIAHKVNMNPNEVQKDDRRYSKVKCARSISGTNNYKSGKNNDQYRYSSRLF